MKKFSTDELRLMFLEYFKEHGHMIEPSASLIPQDDKTLLWINSGVAALKKYFDGSVIPQNRRIANAQKSIRTNDIENVGKTARHHTFFEMLGNFSIGDYFKKEAIEFAWEFLTSEKWIGMDKDKMYVSIHSDDSEAYDIWVNHIKFDSKRILKSDDNYWEIGEGPSGPNSELFYDRGESFDPDNLGERLFFEEIDNDRYLEVWNVVFSQYDAKAGVDRKDYKELPQKNIDTGMGLERLACIVQDVETNFDIDVFQTIIKEIESYANVKYASSHAEAFKIISDHMRTIVFALSDGAMFSNEGRGYVLRRLLRRAVRYSKQIGISDLYLYKLVDSVCESMGNYYPYLYDRKDFVSNLIKAEEERFSETLASGEALLNEALKNSKDNILEGDVAFKLYDTYGFPIELTEEIAYESNFKVDLDGFNEHMQAQKERARLARSSNESMSSQSKDLLEYKLESTFVGYEKLCEESRLIGLFVDGSKVESTTSNFSFISDKTPFYAESGGQAGDSGILVVDNNELLIIDTIKAPNGQHLHIVENPDHLTIEECMEIELKVDKIKREHTRRNHSSIHLVHSALIDLLGDHITQAGSFVNDKYARLDFSHFEKISSQDLKIIEENVNKMIDSAAAVTVELMDLDKAKASGAIALFDEKYADLVRVVTMGEHSKELCGGTHVNNIAEIGIFKILSEESVGSGIRRLNFTTSQNVYDELIKQEEQINTIQDKISVNQAQQILAKIDEILNENKLLKSELEAYATQSLNNEVSVLKTDIEQINNINYISKVYDNLSANDLKHIVDSLKADIKNVLVILATTINNKVVFVVGNDKALIKEGINAGSIAKELAVFTGGNGGGRPDFAQSGGKDINKVEAAIMSVREKL